MAKIPIPKTQIIGLAGNDESTNVLGDPKDAHKIAAATLDVVKQFVEAIIKQDVETAYGLCANELRGWMSIKRFVSALDESDTEFEGKPIEFSVESITWIFCDDSSRQSSNKEFEWPKDTPNPNKRSFVQGWITHLKNSEGDFGRQIEFWVTEETEGYRIAKFKQVAP